MRALALALALPLPALAAPHCAPVQDVSAERAALVAEMGRATSRAESDAIMNRFWLLQTGAPDPTAQRLLDHGMDARSGDDVDTALAAFDQLIDYCPEFVEAYNQRAFVEFLMADYQASLDDLAKVLAAEPDHVAARAGKAVVLMGMGRVAEAQAVLRQALALNPWLPERDMLLPVPGESL